MNLNLTIFRTKMAGGGNCFSYDGLVETTQLDRSRRPLQHYFVLRGGKEYVRFPHATEPAHILGMELGWERYQAWIAHEAAANAELLTIAQTVYPELERCSQWPSLWIEVPGLDQGDDVRYTNTTAAALTNAFLAHTATDLIPA